MPSPFPCSPVICECSRKKTQIYIYIKKGLTSLNVSNLMTSIYSIISIEARLVMHFSGYKTITLHEKAMIYVLNHDFRFFAH